LIKEKHIKWIIIGWIILTISNFYFIPYFIVAFGWFGLLAGFFAITIYQIIKAIKERKRITKLRLYKLTLFLALFFLTFYGRYVDRLLEKVDWRFFYNKRTEIVEQVKSNDLNPNVDWNGWVCELPFEFPVISHGGNDIGIIRNEEKNTTTVTFWIFRNFFSAPSTRLIYTNDSTKIESINKLIKRHPKDNWKIEENWYRTYGE
jgi:hypothetical protein